jgi:nuclear transport factor 2 (NTF2) superfamily protein
VGPRDAEYRLIEELWAFDAGRIAVRFASEWHDDSGTGFRSYGNENCQFDEQGLMRGGIRPPRHPAAGPPRGRPSRAGRTR